MKTARDLTHEGQQRWVRNDRENYEALWAEDVVWTNLDGEETYHGPEEVCGFLWPFRDAWGDDCAIEITEEFGDDTRWTVIGRFKGTNVGSILTPTGPLPPTGKHVDLPLFQYVTARDGKLTSVLNANTVMYTLVQLGLAPVPEGAPA